MSESLRARAEILKLARLLGRDPSELEYLRYVAPEDIAALREQVTEVLFGAHSQVLGRLAAASKLLPIGVVATIGERAFGPVLAARVAGLLEPPRAVEMAARLPTAFLADVAIELDPRRASEVIAGIPATQIACHYAGADRPRRARDDGAVCRPPRARGDHLRCGRNGRLGTLAGGLSARVPGRPAGTGRALAAGADGRDGQSREQRGSLAGGTGADRKSWPRGPEAVRRVESDPGGRRTRGGRGRRPGASAIARRSPARGYLPDAALARLGDIVSALDLSDEEVGRLATAAGDEDLREPVLQLAASAGLSERVGAVAQLPVTRA